MVRTQVSEDIHWPLHEARQRLVEWLILESAPIQPGQNTSRSAIVLFALASIAGFVGLTQSRSVTSLLFIATGVSGLILSLVNHPRSSNRGSSAADLERKYAALDVGAHFAWNRTSVESQIDSINKEIVSSQLVEKLNYECEILEAEAAVRRLTHLPCRLRPAISRA